LPKLYDVRVTVKSTPKGCSQGFQEGDSWLISRSTPGGMCLSAFGAVYRQVMTLRYGGSSPYGEDPDVMLTTCPDPNRGVVYEVKRVTE
jgi:uncharacterized repeat protein (TIGR04076 family)